MGLFSFTSEVSKSPAADPFLQFDNGDNLSVASADLSQCQHIPSLLHLVELNIKGFINFYDAQPSRSSSSVDTDEECGDVTTTLSEVPPLKFADDSSDSDDDLRNMDHQERAQMQQRDAEQLRQSADSFKYADSVSSSLQSGLFQTEVAAAEEQYMRLSPQLSVSNASLDVYEESNESGSLEEDNGEGLDVQSALLSSYDADNVLMEVGAIEDTNDILPRFLDALCNIASAAYHKLASQLGTVEDNEQLLAIWYQVQAMVGGECSRAIFMPGELNRILSDAMHNPEELVHVASGLAIALRRNPPVALEIIVFTPLGTGADEMQQVSVLTLERCADFVISLLENPDEELPVPLKYEVAGALCFILFRLLSAWCEAMSTPQHLSQLNSNGSVCWKDSSRLLERIIQREALELSILAKDSFVDQSAFIMKNNVPDLLQSLNKVHIDFSSLVALLPFSLRLVEILAANRSRSNNGIGDGNYLTDELFGQTLQLASNCLDFILCKSRKGLYLPDARLGSLFFVMSLHFRGNNRDNTVPPECILRSPEYAFASLCLQGSPDSATHFSSSAVKELPEPSSLTVLKSIDHYFIKGDVGRIVRDTKPFWALKGIDVNSARMVPFFEVYEYHDNDGSDCALTLRASIFHLYLNNRQLRSKAIQQHAKIVIGGDAIFDTSGPLSMQDAEQTGVCKAWVSSWFVSAALHGKLGVSAEDVLPLVDSLLVPGLKNIAFVGDDDSPLDAMGTLIQDVLNSSAFETYMGVQKDANLFSLGAPSLSKISFLGDLDNDSIKVGELLLYLSSLSINKVNDEQVYLEEVAHWHKLSNDFAYFSVTKINSILQSLESDLAKGQLFLEGFRLSYTSARSWVLFHPLNSVSNKKSKEAFAKLGRTLITLCHDQTASYNTCASLRFLRRAIYFYQAIIFQSIQSYTDLREICYFFVAEALKGVNFEKTLGPLLLSQSGTLEISRDILRVSAHMLESGFNLDLTISDVMPRNASSPCSPTDYCRLLAEKSAELFECLGLLLKSFLYSRTQIIAPNFKCIERGSPLIYHGISTPTGSFSIGFWLFVPKSRLRKCRLGHAELHILSRLSDTVEVNMIELLQGKKRFLCHPSVYLAFNDDESFVLHVCTSTGETIGGLTELQCSSIRVDEWSHCTVRYRQGRDLSSVSDASEAGLHSSLSLYVNGDLVESKHVRFYKFKLNHKMILGIVSTNLSDEDSVIVSDLYYSSYQKNAVENSTATQARRRDFISAFPPTLITNTLGCILSMFCSLLGILQCDVRMKLPLKGYSNLMFWREVRTILPLAISCGDESTILAALRTVEILILDFGSGSSEDHVVFRLELKTFIYLILEMALALFDANLESRLDDSEHPLYMRLWLQRILMTRKNTETYKFCVPPLLRLSEGVFFHAMTSLLRVSIDILQSADFLEDERFGILRSYLVCSCGGGWPSPLVKYGVVPLLPGQELHSVKSGEFQVSAIEAPFVAPAAVQIDR